MELCINEFSLIITTIAELKSTVTLFLSPFKVAYITRFYI
jgi:hypothetical protein